MDYLKEAEFKKKLENELKFIEYFEQYSDDGISFDFCIEHKIPVDEETKKRLTLSDVAYSQDIETNKLVDTGMLEKFYNRRLKDESKNNIPEDIFLKTEIKKLNRLPDKPKNEYENLFLVWEKYLKEKLKEVENNYPLPIKQSEKHIEKYKTLYEYLVNEGYIKKNEISQKDFSFTLLKKSLPDTRNGKKIIWYKSKSSGFWFGKYAGFDIDKKTSVKNFSKCFTHYNHTKNKGNDFERNDGKENIEFTFQEKLLEYFPSLNEQNPDIF